MSRSYWIYIALLAAFWGASYMFIKVADRAFEPTTMIMFRLLVAGFTLLLVLVAQRGLRPTLAEMRGLGWEGFALGVVNGAIPFTLIAWGEKHVDSGVAAIANASMPIFVVLLAIRWKPSERVHGWRLVGFLIGLVGVGVLAGVHPEGGWWGAAGTMAVVVASVSYAVGQPLGSAPARAHERARPLHDHDDRRARRPGAARPFPAPVARAGGWKADASVVALALIGTALAQILLYRVLRLVRRRAREPRHVPAPATALIYGAVLLGEPLTCAASSADWR